MHVALVLALSSRVWMDDVLVHFIPQHFVKITEHGPLFVPIHTHDAREPGKVE